MPTLADIAGTLSLDVSPYLAGLDQAGKQLDTFLQLQQKAGVFKLDIDGSAVIALLDQLTQRSQAATAAMQEQAQAGQQAQAASQAQAGAAQEAADATGQEAAATTAATAATSAAAAARLDLAEALAVEREKAAELREEQLDLAAAQRAAADAGAQYASATRDAFAQLAPFASALTQLGIPIQ